MSDVRLIDALAALSGYVALLCVLAAIVVTVLWLRADYREWKRQLSPHERDIVRGAVTDLRRVRREALR